MQKQRQVSSHPQKQGRSNPSAQRRTDLPRKMNPVGTSKIIGIEIRLSLATIPLLLIQVNFRLRPKPRPPRKTNAIKEAIEEVIQLLESTSPKWQRITRISLRT